MKLLHVAHVLLHNYSLPNERIQPTAKSAARSSLCFLRRLMRDVGQQKSRSMFQEFTKEEMEIIKKSIHDTFLIINPSALSCSLLSCALEVTITAHKGPRTSVVAGDLYLEGRPLFNSNNDFGVFSSASADEAEIKHFDGHV